MATEEHEEQALPRKPPSDTVPAPSSPPVPNYPELILAAIEALNEKEGSDKTEVTKHIESTCGDLPPDHPTHISHHLNKMKQDGQLVMVKNNYLKPDPNAPPRRGRGRPPKPKSPMKTDTVVSTPRPRGRPPKAKDPLASPPPPKETTLSGTGRKRGRPPKTTGASGRPAKVKPRVAAAPVGA